MRILVVTRSYPSADDLYQYPFVHRRVLAYLRAGHDVAVFRPGTEVEPVEHRFEGVRWRSGDAQALALLAEAWEPDVIAAHGFSESMWKALEPLARALPVRAWLHGSEIPDFFRQKALFISNPAARRAALDAVDERVRFWDRFLDERPGRFGLVFVSHSAVELARVDWGDRLGDGDYAVIANPIDTDLFAYRAKAAVDRFAILSIRPFDSPTYGNDMTAAAIALLSERAGFERLSFTIIGDGPLFDETLDPIRGIANIVIQRRFLTQQEISEEHRRHGIFLVPTRLDTHGVSRDEAMASGLVPVTNAVSAVPEFVDDSCAALAAPDDVAGLADGLWRMVEEPELFLRRSAAAARRVRAQAGHEIVIPRELALLAQAGRD